VSMSRAASSRHLLPWIVYLIFLAPGLALLLASLLVMALFLGVSSLVVGAGLLLTYVGFSLFQVALVNSVSQSLPEHETGVGMGIFNLVGVMSGAVGTALVGRLLAGTWIGGQALLPLRSLESGAGYSNLLLVFSAIVIVGGIMYLRSYRTAPRARALVQDPSEA
jgi:MFS transporter, DHA2 family, metal-tetracycline-proton antiporter